MQAEVEGRKELTCQRRLETAQRDAWERGEQSLVCTATDVALHRAQPILRPTIPTLGISLV
jgi:hypothetical protein